MKRPIKVATRGSRLALVQTAVFVYHLREALGGDPGDRRPIEIHTVDAIGDVFRDDWDRRSPSLPEDDRSRKWTLNLEQRVAQGHFDLAVHSGKDLPFRVFPETEYLPVLAREDARDVFVPRDPSIPFEVLPSGARVGTNSLRRRSNLASVRPDLTFVAYSGNVTTRLSAAHMQKVGVDGIVLAAAGLARLGLLDRTFMQPLDPMVCLPACTQGILAVQLRSDADAYLRAAVERLQHTPTVAAWNAERAFLERLECGSDTPVAAYATVSDQVVQLRVRVPGAGDGPLIDLSKTSGLSGVHQLGVTLADRVIAIKNTTP